MCRAVAYLRVVYRLWKWIVVNVVAIVIIQLVWISSLFTEKIIKFTSIYKSHYRRYSEKTKASKRK